MNIEICASNFESAMAAQNGGAHRIELCEQLAVGGLTPSLELIKRVCEEIDLPVHVLIRPRKGDFCYSEAELGEMAKSIRYFKSLGIAGIVSGVLTKEDEVDAHATATLIEAASGLEFTFHRAFDVCRNPQTDLNKLLELGVHRLLSSGQQLSASEGIGLLMQLKNSSEGVMEIMPGGGITVANAARFVEAGFDSIHLSAVIKSTAQTAFFEGGKEGISDLQTIRTIVDLAQRKTLSGPPGTNLDH